VLLIGGCAHGLGAGIDWAHHRAGEDVVLAPTGSASEDRRAAGTLVQISLFRALLEGAFLGGRALGPVSVVVVQDGRVLAQQYGRSLRDLAIDEAPGAPERAFIGIIAEGSPYRGLVHLMLFRHFPRAPAWIHAGLGEFLSAFRPGEIGGRGVLCFGPSAVAVTEAPIADVLEASWERIKDERIDFFASNALVLVDLLVTREGGLVRFPALLEALGTGRPSRETIDQIYPDLAGPALDEAFRRHLAVLKNDAGAPCRLALRPPEVSPRRKTIEPVDFAKVKPRLELVMSARERAGRASWLPARP
jgi:hypothetical protein